MLSTWRRSSISDAVLLTCTWTSDTRDRTVRLRLWHMLSFLSMLCNETYVLMFFDLCSLDFRFETLCTFDFMRL